MNPPDEPLRLAVDASSAQTGGGLTYLRHLLPRLASRDDVDLAVLLVRERCLSEDWCNLAQEVLLAKGRAAIFGPRWLRTVHRTADLVYAPTEIGFAPPEIPLVLAIRNAVYDRDVCSEFPQGYKRRTAIMRHLARISGRGAVHYIAVSGFAADVGVRNLKVPPDRISVVYHGAPVRSPRPAHAPPHGTRGRGRFLFVSNAPAPYKNIHRLVEALGGVYGEWSLDLAGDIETSYRERIERMAVAFGIRGRIRFHGHCDDSTLDQLYGHSEWFIWPSYGETFGHPLLEAYRAGLKLLVAKAASNHEILGEAACYFPPFDVAQMRDVIQGAVDGKPLRGGGLPRAYSWSSCAQQTAEVLRKMC